MTDTLAGFLGLGGQEVIIILVIVLLLFGAKKLPELARGLGKSLGEFKKAKKELEDELSSTQKDLEKSVREEEQKKMNPPSDAYNPPPAQPQEKKDDHQDPSAS